MAQAHRNIRRYFQLPDPAEQTGFRFYKISGFLKRNETKLFAREAFARVVDKRSKVVERDDSTNIWNKREGISPGLFDALSQNRLITSWEWNSGLPNCYSYFDVSYGEFYRRSTENVEILEFTARDLIVVRYWL